MKRTSGSRISLFILCATLCGATAWSIGDDAVDVPEGPLPLFTPPDSIRPLLSPDAPFHGSNVESKDELYERLRQSLLNLEHRLQEREQEAIVPEPDPVGETPTDPEQHAESGNVSPDAHAIDTTPVPLLDPLSSDPPHPGESPHVNVLTPDSPMTVETPRTTDSPHESETPHASETDHGSEWPHTHDTADESIMVPIAPEAVGSPNIPALADNLYALGEYQLAHGSYQEIDLESLNEEDKIWVTYQLAGCLRHLGEAESAASKYRQILADHPDHYLSGISRWWLDAMEESTEQSQALDVLRTTLLRINEARDASAAP
jgi:tetratricopeptide (TPR) repeat protein